VDRKPLLCEGETITGYKGINDFVEVAERISAIWKL
jgi:hypothetical protein